MHGSSPTTDQWHQSCSGSPRPTPTNSSYVVGGDVWDEATAQAIADRAIDRFGQLDALIHNAAISRDQPLVRMPVEDWDEVIRVNLRGAFLVTKHALRAMIRRRYGRLFYVSSVPIPRVVD
jgi:3-oxoacyl-[acyl-carrier protein] reductase